MRYFLVRVLQLFSPRKQEGRKLEKVFESITEEN